jgi:hypothetical protein
MLEETLLDYSLRVGSSENSASTGNEFCTFATVRFPRYCFLSPIGYVGMTLSRRRPPTYYDVASRPAASQGPGEGYCPIRF